MLTFKNELILLASLEIIQTILWVKLGQLRWVQIMDQELVVDKVLEEWTVSKRRNTPWIKIQWMKWTWMINNNGANRIIHTFLNMQVKWLHCRLKHQLRDLIQLLTIVFTIKRMHHICLDLLVLVDREIIKREVMTNKSTPIIWQTFTTCYKSTLAMAKREIILSKTKISTFKIKNNHRRLSNKKVLLSIRTDKVMVVQRLEYLFIIIIRALVAMEEIRFSLLTPVGKRILISRSIYNRSFSSWQIQINNSRVSLNHIEMKTIEMVHHLNIEI